MTLRRRTTPRGVAPEVEHYVTTGCFSSGLDLATFLLAGAVLRGQLDGLRALWREIGPLVKATHRRQTFAEAVLALSEGARRDAGELVRCSENHRQGGGR
jgi:hypothetical protein